MPDVLDLPAAPVAPVQPSTTAPEAIPLATPKLSSQFDKSIERLQEMMGDPKPQPKPTEKAPAKHVGKPAKAQEQPAKPQETPAKPQETTTKPQEPAAPEQEPDTTTTPAPEEGKPEPKGLGQIVNRQRKQLKQLESEVEQYKAQTSKLAELDAIQKRAEAAEKRRQELEEHIRYVDYTKSDEYLSKYQKPFEDAMSRAVRDVEQLTVVMDEQGNTRQATAQDLMALTQMPLSKMDETAEAWFGKSSARVIRHVERIRELVDTQERAMEDARKNGEERARQSAQAVTTARDQTQKLWKQFNDEDSQKYDFLKEKPEDDEWNSRLTQARELVDKAFSTYAGDPKLTSDQRYEAVRSMVVARNRAIGFTSMKLRAERAEAVILKLQKELDAIKNTSPTGGNGGKGANGSTSNTPINTMQAALDKLSRLG